MQIANLIHRLVLAMDKRADALLRKQFEISFIQFMIISTLYQNPRVTQRFLVQNINMTPGAISRQVDVLVSKRLITRTQNKLNRREHQLKVTKNGNVIVKDARKLLEAELEAIFEPISEQEQQQIVTLVKTVLHEMMVKNAKEIED